MTGPVRPDNQDAFRLPDQPPVAHKGLLCAVADGMGGYAHGRLASTLALERLFEIFDGSRSGASLDVLRRGVESANLSVYQAAQRTHCRRERPPSHARNA